MEINKAKKLPQDIGTLNSLKQEIRALKKQKGELLASAEDRRKIERIRKRIKVFKRLTRKLGRKARAEGKPAVLVEPTAQASPAE